MDADTFGLFAALLAFVAGLGALGLLVARLTGTTALTDAFHPARYHLATLVAAASTAGSLWFSESAGFVPCELCWYQRIAMYPLVIVLGVAASRRGDDALRLPATLLAGVGLAISTYHVQLQRAGSESATCSAEAPCSAIWVDTFGIFTIPTMAACGFAVILALMWCTTAPAAVTAAPEPTDRALDDLTPTGGRP